jgi:hypothetical protein
MVIRTFNIPKGKPKAKVIKTRNGTDVAARYFVYKLYEATDGRPMQWAEAQRAWGALASLPDGFPRPASRCQMRLAGFYRPASAVAGWGS